MPSYKLTYFNLRGRAENARMMFAVAGQPFEDVRLEGEQWLAFKPKTPFGTMPVLEVDGKMLGESRAINYFIARELKLYGATNWESAQIDVIGELLFDLMKPLLELYFGKDEAKKAEGFKKYYAEGCVAKLTQLEEMLKRNKAGDGFFVGDKISLADVAFLSSMEWLLSNGQEGALDKYPKLKALRARVAANKNMAAYLAKRVPTKM